ncbi:MAG: CRISPR-associated endonuclease Cas6 [Candidatus Marinimicrobia bacterium]|nr:CRISPR-associated endonuclease Cas6 [Candidatus Neomarinimicrobiota bacterium]
MELSAYLLTLDKPFTYDAYTLRNEVLTSSLNTEICSFIDGENRWKVQYPRIHFTLLDEKPMIVSMNEAIETTDSFVNQWDAFQIKGQTWHIQSVEIFHDYTRFEKTNAQYIYRFLTPWIGLNRQNFVHYKYLYAWERTAFLNKMLSQNILFLMNDFGYQLTFKISCKIRLHGLTPTQHPEISMGYFTGGFQSNIYLPDYLAMGCGISRGFGTIFCCDKSHPSKQSDIPSLEE